MENAIENNFSEKIQLLELKIDMLEKELEITIKRAEKAEYELDELRRLSKKQKISSIDGIKLTNSNNSTPIKPPPVPPPMPNFNLVANKNSSFLFDKRKNLNSNMDNNDKNNSNSYVKRQQAKNAKGKVFDYKFRNIYYILYYSYYYFYTYMVIVIQHTT